MNHHWKTILEKVRSETSFFCLSLQQKMLLLHELHNTRRVCSESETQSASLLLLLQLPALHLLLQLHRGCCRRLGLCQCAVDGHGLNDRKLQVESCPNQHSSTGVHGTGLTGWCLGGTCLTCVTIPLTSPVLVGSRTVLDSLARLENADTYCSATLSEAAALPFCTRTDHQYKQKPPTLPPSGRVVNCCCHSPAVTAPLTRCGWPWI